MILPPNPDVFERAYLRSLQRPAIIRQVASAPGAIFAGVPVQFKRFEDARGCVVLRIPEYPEGLYCDAP